MIIGKPFLPQIVDRIPGGKEADGKDGYKDNKDITGFDTDRIASIIKEPAA